MKKRLGLFLVLSIVFVAIGLNLTANAMSPPTWRGADDFSHTCQELEYGGPFLKLIYYNDDHPDGQEVDPIHYTVMHYYQYQITLKESYLQTLPSGQAYFAASFSRVLQKTESYIDGTDCTFKIKDFVMNKPEIETMSIFNANLESHWWEKCIEQEFYTIRKVTEDEVIVDLKPYIVASQETNPCFILQYYGDYIEHFVVNIEVTDISSPDSVEPTTVSKNDNNYIVSPKTGNIETVQFILTSTTVIFVISFLVITFLKRRYSKK